LRRREEISIAEKMRKQKKKNAPNVSKSEPAAAVRDPPAEHADGNRGGHAPPKREDHVGDEPDNREARPKYFLLHVCILNLIGSGVGNSREHAP
jgi:hypothetical protein